MGAATTTVCRLSALAVCAGVGVALTSATGGTFLAAMAGSATGGAAGNFFHQIVDGVLSWFGGQKRGQTTLPANYDLDGLTASAIKLVLETSRDRLSADDPKRGVLERLANTPVSTIVEVMQAEDKRLVGDTEIVGTLGTPTGGQTTTVATPEYWQAFVAALMKHTGAAEEPSAMSTPVRDVPHLFALATKALKDVTKQLFAKDVAKRATDPDATDAAVFAAGLLHAHVAAFANDVLRDTFGPQGRFFVAALFNVVNSIATQVQRPPAGLKPTPEHKEQIKAAVKEAVAEALALARATPEPTNGHELAAARAVLGQIGDLQANLSGLGEQFSGVRSDLAALLASQREAHTKLDILLAKLAPKLRLPPQRGAPGAASNPTSPAVEGSDPDRFKASREFLAVVGREEELSELAAWLAREGQFLWDLWTGPAGSGKTRLALQLCRDHPAWQRGFYTWTADNTPDWTLWSPQTDTLIIFDYVAEKAKEIGDAVASLCARLQPESGHPLPPGVKVRFLLLERAALREADPAASASSTPARASALKPEAQWLAVLRAAATLGGINAQAVYGRPNLYDSGRYLGGVSVKDALKIVYSEAAGETPPPSRSQIARRLWAVRRIDRHLRPLFVAMTAEAVREKGGAFDALDGGTGIDALVQHINEKEWEHACARLKTTAKIPENEHGDWAKFLCLATLCGGLVDPPDASKRQLLTEALALAGTLKTPDVAAYEHEVPYACIVSGASKTDAPKLEPDVLGEAFVLWWLEEHPKQARPLIGAAWRLGMTDFVRRAAENFPGRTEISGLLEPVACADPAALAAAHTALSFREYASGDLAALRVRGNRLLTATHAEGQTPLHPPRVQALGAFMWMQVAATPEELEEFLASVDRLPPFADLDAATRELLAMALTNAISYAGAAYARAEDLLTRLRGLADAHPLDATVREQLATGLFNAFNRSPANSGRADVLLENLRDLYGDHPQDAKIREWLAKGLTNAIARAGADHPRADDLLKHLQTLADADPLDAVIREQLAKGLTNAISHAGADHPRADDLLTHLRAIYGDHSQDAMVREWLAKGLHNAIAHAGADYDRTDSLLKHLRAMAQAHPLDAAVREQLASGLFSAFHDASPNSLRADALLALLWALACDYPLDVAVGKEAWKGCGAAFVKSLNPGPPRPRHLRTMAALLQRVAGDDEVRMGTRALINAVVHVIARATLPAPLTSDLAAALGVLFQAYQQTFGPDVQ